MATTAERLTKLEKKAKKIEKQIADLKKSNTDLDDGYEKVEEYIALNVTWAVEVTNMLRQIDWANLSKAFPNTGGGNPPQTPPKWPL